MFTQLTTTKNKNKLHIKSYKVLKKFGLNKCFYELIRYVLADKTIEQGYVFNLIITKYEVTTKIFKSIKLLQNFWHIALKVFKLY